MNWSVQFCSSNGNPAAARNATHTMYNIWIIRSKIVQFSSEQDRAVHDMIYMWDRGCTSRAPSYPDNNQWCHYLKLRQSSPSLWISRVPPDSSWAGSSAPQSTARVIQDPEERPVADVSLLSPLHSRVGPLELKRHLYIRYEFQFSSEHL